VFHVLSSHRPLVITVKSKGKETVCAATVMLTVNSTQILIAYTVWERGSVVNVKYGGTCALKF
jgi:hypothetical protein